MACYIGHLELVKYLISLSRDINIHAQDERAFRLACENGHLEVVEYLISLNRNINIHAQNEEAFRLACRDGKLKLVKYLWEIDKTFKIKYDKKWPRNILKWYNEEYLKVNPNIQYIIQNDKLHVITEGIVRKCNICYDEKHIIMFGCQENHGLCKECFLEYYEDKCEKCMYCMKPLTVDNMYIVQ
jgi:ankyrin repeat protein